jgi:hypothetical protein
VGVARFVRLADRPASADFAVTVIDDWQRKGLGRFLLTRLIAAARERGIERLESSVLATNAAMRHIIRSVVPGSIERADGRLVAVEMPLNLATSLSADDVPARARLPEGDRRAPSMRRSSTLDAISPPGRSGRARPVSC